MEILRSSITAEYTLGQDDLPMPYSPVGIDGCVYAIPSLYIRIMKYDPFNDTTSFVGEIADKFPICQTNGALGIDGCIYALANRRTWPSTKN